MASISVLVLYMLGDMLYLVVDILVMSIIGSMVWYIRILGGILYRPMGVVVLVL